MIRPTDPAPARAKDGRGVRRGKAPRVRKDQPMILDNRPSAAVAAGRDAAREAGEPGPWGVCEVLLVADRSRGSTHSFFRAWRFEAVMRSGRPTPGTVLVAAPLALGDVDGVGWGYELRLLDDRPGPSGVGEAAFSWRATGAPGTPDPLAAALGRVRAWLAANDWEQDPLHPTRYHG